MLSALQRNSEMLDHQEIANLMYGLALMTFDAPYTEESLDECLASSERLGSTTGTLEPAGESPTDLVSVLWQIHMVLIKVHTVSNFKPEMSQFNPAF